MCTAGLFLAGTGSILGQSGTYFNQRDDTYRVLGLRRAREAYEVASAEYQRLERLAADGQISQAELDRARGTFADAEVNYHQSLLAVLFERQFVSVVAAVKRQEADGSKHVRLRLATTSGGSAELRKLVAIDDALFRSLQPDVVTNIYISLLNDTNAIVSQPYEAKIDELRHGSPQEIDFTLLQDLDAVTVNIIYANGASRSMKVYLQKDAGANRVGVQSQQFSQEAELGTTATFDLTLELFSRSANTFALEVVNLPAQIGRVFKDPTSGARLSQLRFTESSNTRRAVLEVSLPDRPTDEVAMDRAIRFDVLVVPRQAEGGAPVAVPDHALDEAEIARLGVGFAHLELVPRGKGRLLVRAPLLYHSVHVGEPVTARVEVVNEGTRRLDNVELALDAPLGWERRAEPTLLSTLAVGEERAVALHISPPSGAAPGRYEVRLRTTGRSDTQPVTAEDKTVTVEILPKPQVLATALLVCLVLGLIAGIVVLGVRMSRR